MWHGTGGWAKGSIDERVAAYEAALSVLRTCSIEVIARGANLERFERRYGGTDPHRWEFRNLLERFNERLISRNEFGLVIADQQHEYRELLQADVAEAKEIGTGGYRNQKLTRVVDTAHFVDSKLSRTTQLADVVGFILRRRASIPQERDIRVEAIMQRLWNSVFAAIPDPSGQYFTIR
jgi:hypothetical protein